MNSKILLLGGVLLTVVPPSSANGAGGGGGGGASDGNLVAMEAISVPIIDGAKMQGTLRFSVVLKAHDGKAATSIAGDMPGLRTEALFAGAEFSRLRASPFLAVDARELSDELTKALHARNDGIDRVLLVEVSARTS